MNSHIEKARKYFEVQLAEQGDSELLRAIPELLKVIADLDLLKPYQRDTDDYLDAWRKSKIAFTRIIKLPDGKRVEADIADPDTSEFDKYLAWLWGYFQHEYKNKTGATIGCAYAFEALTMFHNRLVSDPDDLPNTNWVDVKAAVASEDSGRTATWESVSLFDLPRKTGTHGDVLTGERMNK